LQEQTLKGQEYQTEALFSQQLKQRGMLLSFYYARKLTLAKSPQILLIPLQAKDQKRKQSQKSNDPLVYALLKRLQTFVAGLVAKATSSITNDKINLIDY
jgi:hypothetical protein